MADQLGNAAGRDQPDAVLADLSILMGQYVALRDNLLPGNLRMLRLEGRRHEAGGPTDDLNGAFHGKLQLAIAKLFVERHVNGEIPNGTCRVEHVP